MSTTSLPHPVLDHVALASRHAWSNLIRYSYELGGHWLGAPPMAELENFYFCQVELAGGTKLELLEPLAAPGSEFLRRFLDRNGPGPHHITFKVPDFDEALESVRHAGYEVVGENRDDPQWHEAFLHPRSSHGIVIQLAFDDGPDDEEWSRGGELPPNLRAEPPDLVAVRHLVADLDSAVKLFTGPLAMVELGRDAHPDGEAAQLGCGPWHLELIQPSAPAAVQWLGTRPGRLWHLELALDEPGTVSHAVPLGQGRYEVPPEANLGTRLIVGPRPTGGSR